MMRGGLRSGRRAGRFYIYLIERETKRTKHCRGVASLANSPRELKLGTKVLTFVLFESFSNYGQAKGGSTKCR